MNESARHIILETLFDDNSLEPILDQLTDRGMLTSECYEDIGYRKQYHKERVLDELFDLMTVADRDFDQKSFTLKGFNGVYPCFNAEYPFFEPSIYSFSVNMKTVASNDVGHDCQMSLCTPEDSSKPSLVAMIAEPRNCGSCLFLWFVDAQPAPQHPA